MRLAAVVLLLVALLPAGAAASTRAAQVYVVSLSPVSVHGASFRARERVTVTVLAKTTRAKIVYSSARGNFTATFSALSIGRCEAYAVRAKGNRGSTAYRKIIPACAPP